MANGMLDDRPQHDWVFASPWPWMFLGLGLCLVNWATALVSDASLNGLGLTFVFLGMLAAGAGAVIRLSSTGPAFLNQAAPKVRNGVLVGLCVIFAGVVAVTTGFLILRFFDVNPAGLRLNGLLILWAIVAPISAAAAAYCLKRARPGVVISPPEEAAAVLAVLGLTAFCACWALYNPASPEDWDSLRLFLAVVFVVALAAAPLLVISQGLRRLVVTRTHRVAFRRHLHGRPFCPTVALDRPANMGENLSALSRIHVPK